MSGDPPSTSARNALTGDHAAALLDLGFHDIEEGSPVGSPPREGDPDDPDREGDRPGDMVSRYRLIEPLGEGGFGVVWAAEQIEPIHRAIALKLVKRGMDSREIIARFAAESQALALMDHPNIAAVLDAGTTPDGRPFFAMEQVKGEPLVSYCNSRSMGLRERIELFIPVCQAVQHAHQKAILHRDLKPSNILVAEIDGKPVAKVIDFGIAKALGATPEAAMDSSLLYTRAGAILGTLPYMSPEQAGSVADVDTRSDIYSLGVLLYELLTGGTPLQLGTSPGEPYDETLRRIRTEEAPRPSLAIRDSGGKLTRCASDAKKMRRSLRGDLDWIAIKALEKDRRRRYETATALATDLRHYLEGQTVSAAAPTWSYQFSKFARRNRPAFIAAGVVIAALVAGTTISLNQAAKAKRESAKAEANRIDAVKSRGDAETNLARARGAVDQFLNQITDDPRLREGDFLNLRRSLLESALPFYEELSATDAPGLPLMNERNSAFNRLGLIYQELGRPEKSAAALRHSVDLCKALVAAEPGNPEHRRSLNTALNNLALAIEEGGDRMGALDAQRRAAEGARELAKAFPGNSGFRHQMVSVLVNFGRMLSMQQQGAEAMDITREALVESERLTADFPGNPSFAGQVGYVHSSLAAVMHRANDPQAEAELRKAREVQETHVKAYPTSREDRRLLATTCQNLGHILTFSGRHGEALESLREATAQWDRLNDEVASVPEYRASAGMCRSLIGMCLMSMGRSWEAEPELQEAAGVHHQLGVEFPDEPVHAQREGVALDLLAQLKRKDRQWMLARGLYERSIESHRRALALRPDDPEARGFLAQRRDALARMALEQGDTEQAVRDALAIPEHSPGRWQETASAATIVALAVAQDRTREDLPEAERQAMADRHAASAVALLQEAIDARFPYVPELASDPAFDPLRGYPAFQALKEAPPDGDEKRSPEQFTFDYQHLDPGPRLWRREQDRWTETQPSGQKNEYKILQRIRLRGVSGTELLGTTGEKPLHIFIPDKDSPDPKRLSMSSEAGKWSTLGDIKGVR